MIVQMKKISLIIRGDKKEESLKILRELGMIQIEISEGFGERLVLYRDQTALLERAAYEIGSPKNSDQKAVELREALDISKRVEALTDERRRCQSERTALVGELDRIGAWGEVDPEQIKSLSSYGLSLELYEMPKRDYDALSDEIRSIRISTGKRTVKFVLIKDESGTPEQLEGYRFMLPKLSTSEMRKKISELESRTKDIEEEIASYACYCESIDNAIKELQKSIEFETYATGMRSEELSGGERSSFSVAYFGGYIEAENLDSLKETAAENSWGLFVDDPTEEDDVPTKLKNNKFVSLIYPLTDFLGTVPGYFEYDISGWFLSFLLIFFGIIFGDGGYGLLVCAVAAIPIVRALIIKKPIAPAFLLIGLFGLSTVLWGTLTCTWFGLSPDMLPQWIRSLSVPVISNVYADKIWSLPWTPDGVGLTTAQNLQIFCFTLALIQLTVAHIKGAVRYGRSLKMLGHIGSSLQLFGIYYVVLSLVVNSEVFGFGLVVGGVPVGTVAIVLIATGFVLSFMFSNYEGSVIRSLLSSLKNIVSVLLGVVNVFSDIVSYIRLWAVGLAGATISATVNELASPMLGNLMFMVIAIVLLVFGHGLNMILNILSVIVHGIRLNTLEFSSHLDMSWSGHKFKPFEE